MSQVISLKAGTLQTLANANGGAITSGTAVAAGTDLDNTTELAIFFDFELTCGFGTSVLANRNINLYLVPKMDGTNASDQDSPTFQPSCYRGSFITATGSTVTRRLTLEGIPIGPYVYTAYLHSTVGVTLSANWTLKAFPSKYLST